MAIIKHAKVNKGGTIRGTAFSKHLRSSTLFSARKRTCVCVISAHVYRYLSVTVALRIEPWHLPLNWPTRLADPTGFARLVTEELSKVVTVKRNWCATPILPSDWLKHLVVVFLERVGWQHFRYVSLSFYEQTVAYSDGSLSLFPRETSH